MARVFGIVFSGFMVRLYAAIMAVTVAYYVWGYVSSVFTTAGNAMSALG